MSSKLLPDAPSAAADPDAANDGCGPLGLFGRKRRGTRLFDAGGLRLVVLGLIGEEPRHGYDIIRGLKARFHGAYSPSPGSIYPILQALKQAELVSSTSWGPRRLFAITEAGKAYLAEHKAELDAINAQLDEAASPIDESSIGDAIKGFRATLFRKMRKGLLNPDQAARLRDILIKAREDIERL